MWRMLSAVSLLLVSIDAVGGPPSPMDEGSSDRQLETAAQDAFDGLDWRRAMALSDSLVTLLRSTSSTTDSRLEAALYRLGESTYYAKGPAAALPVFEECVAILSSEEAPAAHVLLSRRSALGECLRATNRYDEAGVQFDLALKVLRNLGERDRHPCEEAEALNNIAGFHKDLEQLDQAERLLREALKLSATCSESRVSNAHLNLAEVLRLQFRYQEAIPHYEMALQKARSAYGPGNYLLVFPLNQFAEMLRRSSDVERAIKLRQEALGVVEALDPPRPIRLGQVLHDLAAAYLVEGRLPAARATARRAIQVQESIYGPGHPDLVASHLLSVEVAFESRAEEDAVLLGRIDHQLEVLTDAMAASSVRARGLALRADLLRRSNQRSLAIESLERCLDILETGRSMLGGIDTGRAWFLAEHRTWFEDLAELYFEAGDLAADFRTTERARARVLEDQIVASREGHPIPATPEREGIKTAIAQVIRDRTQLEWSQDGLADDTVETLARYDARLDSLVTAYEATEAREHGNAAPDGQTHASAPIALRDVGRLLAPNGGMLSYFVGEKQSHGLFVPREGEPYAFALRLDDAAARRFELPAGSLTLAELSSIIGTPSSSRTQRRHRGVVDRLSEPSRRQRRREQSALQEDLAQLRRVLVPAEVWERVKACSEIIVIPDGPLHLLPFEALIVEDPPRAAEFWLDVGPPLRYASSATTLALLQQRSDADTASGDELLSVGAPVFAPASQIVSSRGRLGSLPWALAEVEGVTQAWGPSRSTRLVAEEATESKVRSAMAHHSILHFATHGVVNVDAHRLRAALALTLPVEVSDPEEDGFLHLYELSDMQLHAKLAVLSACNTQYGEIIRGEGAFALSRGFLAAGVERVVSTLWSVDDEASKELIVRLFSNLSETGVGEDSAVLHGLCDAKHAIRESTGWEDPYFWAAFTLRGAR